MSKSSRNPDELVPLKPKDHYILSALFDEERYAYAIAKEVRRQSGGRVRVEAGNLHRHIQKLIRQGLVAMSDRRPAPEAEDERRRYYTITDAGRDVWAADIRHMESVVQAARERTSLRATRGT